MQFGPGRKRYDISRDQLEHLRSLSLRLDKKKLICCRRVFLGPRDEFERNSDITDDELDQIYASVTGNSREGPLTPNMGRRRFIGALRSRGLRAQRWRVSECLRRVSSFGTALWWRMAIHRREYFVPTPNSL